MIEMRAQQRPPFDGYAKLAVGAIAVKLKLRHYRSDTAQTFKGPLASSLTSACCR